MLPLLREFILYQIAALAVGGALGLAGVGVSERPQEPLTQLWAVPRPDYSAVDVGIRNQEGHEVTYQLVALSGDTVIADERNIQLAADETWKSQLPSAIRGTEIIEILLYRQDAPLSVYRSVRLAAPVHGAQ